MSLVAYVQTSDLPGKSQDIWKLTNGINNLHWIIPIIIVEAFWERLCQSFLSIFCYICLSIVFMGTK